MKKRGFEIISTYKNKNIKLPERKTTQSAGYDIAASDKITILPQQVAVIATGLKAYMQPNEYLGIHIRSGLSLKNSLALVNGQGIIDADYYNNEANEGHIMIAVINLGKKAFVVEAGMRIAQGIFYQYLTADDDNAKQLGTVRTGGMGSTGA